MRLPLSGEAWSERFRTIGAAWWHDGDIRRPHVVLTSGLHSNGFMNGDIFKQWPHLMDEAASDLVTCIEKRGLNLEEVDCVVGPAMGAITLAHDVARYVTSEIGRPVRATYAEKLGEKAFGFDRTQILPGERVLIVEDVVTTGGSSLSVAQAVRDAGGAPLPFIGSLITRCNDTTLEGFSIAALTGFYPPAWEKEECLLCQKGSEAIRPKGKAGWEALTRNY